MNDESAYGQDNTTFNLNIELPTNFYLSKDIINFSRELENYDKSCFISGRAGTGKQLLYITSGTHQKKKLLY